MSSSGKTVRVAGRGHANLPCQEDINGLAHLDAIYPRGFAGRFGLVAAN